MNKPMTALALCAGLAAAVPATAEVNTATQYASSSAPRAQKAVTFDPTRDTTESMQGYARLVKHGDCLIAAGQSAEGLLTTMPNSKAERRKTAKLRGAVDTCPAKGLENIHSLVRGSLAEAMYVARVRQAPTVDAARGQAFVNAEKAFQAERDQGDQVMASVMSCMVAASPDKAHAVLIAQHGSNQEATAMDAFFAAAQKCGAGASRPSNLSRSFIRAFVADSAWRLARTVVG